MLKTPQNTSASKAETSDPDADLILALQARDETALGALMDRHMSAIHSLAFYMLGDHMEAENVTQSVFLKTWAQAPNWRSGEAKLLTWMMRVATHACLDIRKKKKPIYTDTLPETLDGADTPFQAFAKSEQSQMVKSALAQLPESQCAALTLSYYQGVSQKDGAQILGVSESAYESLLVRARKKLKIILTQVN